MRDLLILSAAVVLLAIALIAGASPTPPEPGPRDGECRTYRAGDRDTATRHVLVCRYGPLLCAYTLDVQAGFSCARAGP